MIRSTDGAPEREWPSKQNASAPELNAEQNVPHSLASQREWWTSDIPTRSKKENYKILINFHSG